MISLPTSFETVLCLVDSVTVLRKSGAGKQSKSAAQRSGNTTAQAKYSTGSNRQTGTGMDAAKLDRDTESTKHKTVSKDVGKLIMQGRNAKGWTQKELATRIQEKP